MKAGKKSIILIVERKTNSYASRILVTSFVNFEFSLWYNTWDSQKPTKLFAWISDIQHIKWSIVHVISESNVIEGVLTLFKGISFQL